MAKYRKPRCFVAMAFDQKDTEELYEKSIQSVLKSNDIIPVIINRREDNRDINNQIIEQLNTCDFVIADLTYTRPSVYFEAGYAQRKVEVIYTVRSDHLKQGQPENKRVHFDLQMKPIVKWTTADSESFRTSLERRLKNTVLRDFRRAQAIIEKGQMQKDNFAHMSLTDRLLALRGEALRSLNHLGFSFWERPDSSYKAVSYRQNLADLKQDHWLMSTVRKKRLISLVSLRVEESLTLKKLCEVNFFMGRLLQRHLPYHERLEEKFPVNKTVEHHVLCSLKVIPKDRIMSAMPKLRWESALNCYAVVLPWVWKRMKRSRGEMIGVELSVERHIYVHIIDNIKSLAEYKTRLEMIMNNIKQG